MNLLELSQKRFSVRKFTAEQVSEEDLKYILEVTRMAPSAVNKQPWSSLWSSRQRHASSCKPVTNVSGLPQHRFTSFV